MYKSWLRSVFRIYIYDLRIEVRGSLQLQTSNDQSRFEGHINAPSVNDSYNIYAIQRRHKLETGTKDGKTWRILYINIAGIMFTL